MSMLKLEPGANPEIGQAHPAPTMGNEPGKAYIAANQQIAVWERLPATSPKMLLMSYALTTTTRSKLNKIPELSAHSNSKNAPTSKSMFPSMDVSLKSVRMPLRSLRTG